jgi:hypothetical protein
MRYQRANRHEQKFMFGIALEESQSQRGSAKITSPKTTTAGY